MEKIQETKIKKTHGFWLSVFPILMFIVNFFSAYIYFTNPAAMTDLFPKASTGLIYFLGCLCLVNVLLAVGIWGWKKWGIYGFYLMAVLSFVINIYVGVGLKRSLSGLIGGIIIFLVTRKRLHDFS